MSTAKNITKQKTDTTLSITAITMPSDTTVILETKNYDPKPKLSKNKSLLKTLQEQYSEDYESYQRVIRKLLLQQMKNNILKKQLFRRVLPTRIR